MFPRLAVSFALPWLAQRKRTRKRTSTRDFHDRLRAADARHAHLLVTTAAPHFMAPLEKSAVWTGAPARLRFDLPSRKGAAAHAYFRASLNMRAAVDRFSALLVGWVPDLSQAPPRRRLTIGAVTSLVLHLLLFGGWFIASLVLPRHVERPVPAEPPHTLEVELRPMSSSPDDVPTVAQRKILDTDGLKASSKPENATFESDKDMRAASELPARGTLPLPSQDGRTDEDSPVFADQEVRLAAVDTSAVAAQAGAPGRPPAPQAEQPPQESSTPATPPPLFTPQPVAKEELTKATALPPKEALPEPAKTARATPPPLEQVETPRPDQMAVSKPSPATTPGPITRLELASASKPSKVPPRGTPWMAELPLPHPFAGPSAAQRYQAELKKTRLDGEISNRGEASVDAIATPAGRWEALTKRSIGRNWNELVKRYNDTLEIGKVTVAFTVDSDGHTHDLHVQGGGNRALEAICLKAIEETPIPAPPGDMLDALPDRRVPQELSFVLY
jgi:outer membrane biosynthesis protein TonB